ncbi:ADP-ribose pyrophosphatase [Planctomycetaceae bacterium]|nr:ADP-ribose pyrophosphatase [Planctomycetaceae bacterium]
MSRSKSPDAHADSIPGAIRVAARAMIIEHGKLLVMNYRDDKGSWCVTPGGGVHKKETLKVGLAREVLEELGLKLEVGDIVYVRELLGSSAKVLHGGITQDTHQLEVFFRCKRLNEPRLGATPDKYCTGFEWVALEELPQRHFFPEVLSSRMAADVAAGFKPINNYLGDS